MNPGTQTHLTALDRTIVNLCNERARLIAAAGDGDSGAHVDDLLRRSPGPFPASALREAFDAIDRGCQEARP